VGAAIAETIAHEFITGAALSTATAAATGCRACFKEKHLAIDACLKIRVRPLRYTGNRNDSLLQSVKINLDHDWTTWSTLPAGGFTAASTLTARSVAGARSGLRTACARANAAIFIALRQQRACISFSQDREIEPEGWRVIVGGHVEPLRTQTEVGRREKPEILAACVPGRPNCVCEPIGNLFGLARLNVAHEDRVIKRTQPARVCDPLRIRTPHRIQ